jgi:outer membrane immunogenic protein
MRRLCWALLAMALASPAAAADLGVPPVFSSVGPGTSTCWCGFYFGGQFGMSDGDAQFRDATQPLIAYILRDTLLEEDQSVSKWPVLGTANNTAVGYGGFVGFNAQFESAVIGVEANYNHAAFALHAPAYPIGRTTSDTAGNAYAVNFTGSGSLTADDFFTLRVKGGWAAGPFLPYAFVGLAGAVASTSVSVTGTGEQYSSGTVGVCSATQVCVGFPITGSFTASSQVLYGFTLGGGVDFAVTQNIFVRAEVEYDQFNPPPGYYFHVVTGRIGGGLKF